MEITGSTNARGVSSLELRRQIDIESERKELIERRRAADELREQFLSHVREITQQLDKFA